MRTRAKWVAFGALAAFVAFAFGSVARAEDDFATFTLQTRTFVGQVTLDPGSYNFRAIHSTAAPWTVRVSSTDDSVTYALLAAWPQPLPNAEVASGNRLTWDRSEQGRLLTWEVGNKGFVLYFPANGLEPGR
jgi:hypothetical protein